jgi:hypothetical protein
VGTPQAIQQTGENGTVLLPHQKSAVSGARQTNLVVRFNLTGVLDGNAVVIVRCFGESASVKPVREIRQRACQ